MALFKDILALAHKYSSPDCPFDINIEIKGVQGSKQPFETNDYLEKIAQEVTASDIPVDRVLFSSFSLENVAQMSHILPTAQYGMLFAEKGEVKPIYADHQNDPAFQYMQFSKDGIEQVLNLWDEKSAPNVDLKYLHPEIDTVSIDEIKMASDKGLGINCWALFEELTDARKQQYADTFKCARDNGVFFSSITDYCDDMIKLAKKLNNDDASPSQKQNKIK